jgi:hypothetical protein
VPGGATEEIFRTVVSSAFAERPMKNGAIAAVAAVPLTKVRREVEGFLDIRVFLGSFAGPGGDAGLRPNQDGIRVVVA